MGDAAIYTFPIMETTERTTVQRNFPSFRKQSPLDVQIEAHLKKMQGLGVDHEDYPKMIKQLEQLYELRKKETPKRVSRDTVMIVVGNLVGILIVVAFEQKHVITSKQLSNVVRPRIPE